MRSFEVLKVLERYSFKESEESSEKGYYKNDKALVILDGERMLLLYDSSTIMWSGCDLPTEKLISYLFYVGLQNELSKVKPMAFREYFDEYRNEGNLCGNYGHAIMLAMYNEFRDEFICPKQG